MDDLISRQTLMKEFSDFVRASNNSDFVRTPTWNNAVSLVESIPPAQPEIIKCKDCKWKQGSECVRFADIRIYQDDFCSRAERRSQ